MDEIELGKIILGILENFENIKVKFSKLRVAVLGDVMIDTYYLGDSTRISPEAPVPVVNIAHIYSVPGGAANVALNIKKIGNCKVKLFGIIGNDENGKILKQKLQEYGIEPLLAIDEKRPTTSKIRVVARGQQIIRIDSEKSDEIPKEVADKIIKEFEKDEFDVVILSDYAKGFFTKEICENIKSTYSKKCVCDPKPQNIELFENVYAICPNEKEAIEILRIFGLKQVDEIKEKIGVEKLIITQGEKGISFYSENKRFRIPALAKEVYDVTGAGDTVTSAFALCSFAGLEDEVSLTFASISAAIKVSHRGTYAPDQREIYENLKIFSELMRSKQS